jgi:hypothetical protein
VSIKHLPRVSEESNKGCHKFCMHVLFVRINFREKWHRKFTQLMYKNLEIVQPFLTRSTTVVRYTYNLTAYHENLLLFWNAWFISPLLYNPVRIGDHPHSFYRRYIPATLNNIIMEATYNLINFVTARFVRLYCFETIICEIIFFVWLYFCKNVFFVRFYCLCDCIFVRLYWLWDSIISEIVLFVCLYCLCDNFCETVLFVRLCFFWDCIFVRLYCLCDCFLWDCIICEIVLFVRLYCLWITVLFPTNSW